MFTLDKLINKISVPIFALIILAFALALIIYQNPLNNGCETQISNFKVSVKGILKGYVTKKKLTQFDRLTDLKKICTQANTQGACFEYFSQIRKVVEALQFVPEICYSDLKTNFTNLLSELADAVKIISLSAWGSEPPESVSNRLGWITEPDLRTFCKAKDNLIKLTSLEAFADYRKTIYNEFPDKWPKSIPIETRSNLERPRALKSAQNPNGRLSEAEIYSLSLFSIRCDLFL